MQLVRSLLDWTRMIPTILLPSLTTCLGDVLKASQLHGTSVKRLNLTAGPKTLQYIPQIFILKRNPRQRLRRWSGWQFPDFILDSWGMRIWAWWSLPKAVQCAEFPSKTSARSTGGWQRGWHCWYGCWLVWFLCWEHLRCVRTLRDTGNYGNGLSYSCYWCQRLQDCALFEVGHRCRSSWGLQQHFVCSRLGCCSTDQKNQKKVQRFSTVLNSKNSCTLFGNIGLRALKHL